MNIRMVRVSKTVIAMLVLILVLYFLSDVAVADEGNAHVHKHLTSVSLFSFVKPLGICALSLILITFGTGLFRRKLRRRFLKVHKVCAWLTVGLALCHGILVLSFF